MHLYIRATCSMCDLVEFHDNQLLAASVRKQRITHVHGTCVAQTTISHLPKFVQIQAPCNFHWF